MATGGLPAAGFIAESLTEVTSSRGASERGRSIGRGVQRNALRGDHTVEVCRGRLEKLPRVMDLCGRL